MRRNSFSLFVTRVSPVANACAAIQRSLLPIISPFEARPAEDLDLLALEAEFFGQPHCLGVDRSRKRLLLSTPILYARGESSFFFQRLGFSGLK
jgi:hypothetical protein